MYHQFGPQNYFIFYAGHVSVSFPNSLHSYSSTYSSYQMEKNRRRQRTFQKPWFSGNPKMCCRKFSLFSLLKVKVSRYRPGLAQRVGRGIALFFHDRGTRRG